MQDYDFLGTDTFPVEMTAVLPSKDVVKNILDFAKSYQAIEVDGLQFDLFLN